MIKKQGSYLLVERRWASPYGQVKLHSQCTNSIVRLLEMSLLLQTVCVRKPARLYLATKTNPRAVAMLSGEHGMLGITVPRENLF